MGHEVDFLAVGDGSKSGDAIALRFGNLYGERAEQAVIVIDGGFKDDGQKLIDLIKKYYGNTNIIDLVIATHTHGDHTAGLETILKEMQVNELWMHRPWDESHTNNISKWFTDGRVTDNSVREALRKSLDTARELEKIAIQKGIPIIEPFVGVCKDFGFGRIDIAGPTKEYYESLLPDFSGTPESKTSESSYGLLERVLSEAKGFVKKIAESWGIETLDDSGETSAENNSSAITLLRVDDKHLLFTGDAGIPALTNAVDLLESSGITNEKYSFIQVPHHGSKQNVGQTILDRILGFKLPEEQKNTNKIVAFCSCAKDGDPKHPAKKVMNAFKRRGAPVTPTQDRAKVYPCNNPNNAPIREEYSPVDPLPFYDEVDE
jgi:beta-lactamase superfamily II metal-dependent hydrolase